MALTIKNETASAGKSHRSAPDLVETLMAISRRCSSLPDLDRRSTEEILGYDESGAFLGRYTPREVR